jgi:hypothetical protein
MNKISPKLLFLILFLLVFIIYLPTLGAGFVSDFAGWMNDYKVLSFNDLIVGSNHRIKSFYFLTHIILFLITYIFAYNPLVWMTITIVLFVGVLYLFSRIISIILKKDLRNLVIIGPILLIAFSPYNTEILVWKAGFHYLLAIGFIFSQILLFLKYLDTNQRKFLILGMLIFVLSLFVLELFFIAPVCIFSFLMYYQLQNSKLDLKKLLSIGFLQLVFVFIFMISYKLTWGKWIPHYGTERHMEAFSFLGLSNYFKYAIKHLFFVRYLSFENKNIVFEFFDKGWVVITSTIIVIAILFWGLLKKERWIIFLMLFNYILFLFPASGFWMSTLNYIENDRFGFIPAMFLIMALFLFILELYPKIGKSLFIISLGVSLYCLIFTTKIWRESDKTVQNLSKNFNFKSDTIYITNLPDNMLNAPMFKLFDRTGSGLQEYLTLYFPENKSHLEDVAQQVMHARSDGVKVEVIDSTTVKVQMLQWGGWFTKGGEGLENYKTKDYVVTVQDQAYEFNIKYFKPRPFVIYHNGNSWQKVVWNK